MKSDLCQFFVEKARSCRAAADQLMHINVFEIVNLTFKVM